MAPDLNSLPPSATPRPTPSSAETPPATSSPGQSPSPLSRTTSISLQAAAALNAGLQHEGSRRSSVSSLNRNRPSSNNGRRRSTVLMNLQLNDPTIPSPGEMQSVQVNHGYPSPGSHFSTDSPLMSSGYPQHFRTPSLGEIHQELEQEQEAQVNRLLQTIRVQQQQLQQMQAASGQAHPQAAIDDCTPTSERSMSFSNTNTSYPLPSTVSTPRSPSGALHPGISFETSRPDIQRHARTPSQTASPRVRSTSNSGEGQDYMASSGRSESSYYQAETQMMVRENQMLRQRIRELERQVSELNVTSAITHEPATHSHLLASSSVTEDGAASIPGSAGQTETSKQN